MLHIFSRAMVILVLTSQEDNDSPEKVFPDDPVLVVHHTDADVLVPQDVDSYVAGETVCDEDSKREQALDDVGLTETKYMMYLYTVE